MTDLNLTIDPAFADLAGNTMEASHWTTPLDEIETFLHGLVGRDGVGADNWKSNGSVHAPGFRKNAVTETFRLQNPLDAWTVVPETALSGGPPHGITPSPAPGGYLRFYLRADAEFLFLAYTGRVIGAGASSFYDVRSALDGGTALNTMRLRNLGNSSWTSARLNWAETTGANIQKGWHYVSVYIEDVGNSPQVIFGATELVVVAAYK